METQEEIARVKSDIEALVAEFDSKRDLHEQAYRPLDILCGLLRYIPIGLGLFGLPALAVVVWPKLFAWPDLFAWPGKFQIDNPIHYIPFAVGGILGCFIGAWIADPVNGPCVTSKRIHGRTTLKAQVRQQFIDRYAQDTPERKTAVQVLHGESPPDQSSKALFELRWLTEDEWKDQTEDKKVSETV